MISAALQRIIPRKLAGAPLITSFKRLRSFLILLVLAAIFPTLIGVILYGLAQQQNAARLQAQETALRIARLSAREQERLITGAHHLLMTLAELPVVRRHRAAECSALFAGILKKFPYYTNVAAVTPQGDIFCSGLVPRANQANIADRAYFQEALKERRLGISHVLVGRMSGKPNISIAYPAIDPNGSVDAVVFVGLDLTWLNSMTAEAELPPRATVFAIDHQGTVFVRYPQPASTVAAKAAPSLVKTIIEQREGVTEAEGPDGVRRLFGFTTLHRLSQRGALFVAVGIPSDIAFAVPRRIFLDGLIVSLIAVLLAGFITWLGAHLLVRRKLDNLVAAARVLGEAEADASAATPGLVKAAGDFDRVIDEMRRALRKATGRQADFAAMIAHDFRNPVQTIQCAASLLSEAETAEKVFADMIRRGCTDLTAILDEFLDFSKYQGGYLKLEKEEFDLYEFFDGLCDQYSFRAQQSGLDLRFEVSPDIGSLCADRRKLQRVFDNLLGNALKFTSAGAISAGARRSRAGLELWVKDTGTGLDPLEVKKLFSPYRQASNAQQSKTAGTGLGLLICKLIIEAHGGHISVESQVDRGTAFRIILPETADGRTADTRENRAQLG